jgi:hypothetical protein
MEGRMKKTHGLTQGERRYLEHARKAADRGITLAQYCRECGLSVQLFYSVKSALQKKLAPSSTATAAAKAPGSGGFLAVRIASPSVPTRPPSAAVGGGVCRLRHPSGWVMECASLPPASWMAQLLNGGTYVGN